ncbi:Hypothetical protein A7982_10618 [Minicystis rosea]|nr:Hypothetical protein A7982_10618 [Minicystis rosea]
MPERSRRARRDDDEEGSLDVTKREGASPRVDDGWDSDRWVNDR